MDIKISDAEIAVMRESSDLIVWPSRYNYLLSHNSHRPGRLHTYLGNSGAGKSTLTRSLIQDVLEHESVADKKIGLWLSEESEIDFLTEFTRAGIKIADIDKRLKIYSEINSSARTMREHWENFLRFTDPKEIDFLIFDNPTTSVFYMDRNPDVQSRFAKQLKIRAYETGMPYVVFMHTDHKITGNINRTISPNDIRGNKSIVNVSEFFYVIQMFEIKNNKIQTITIHKHRGQNITGRFFMFKYNTEKRFFDLDVELDFEELKKIFKARNVL